MIYYISNTGSNSNNGTSEATPFQTIGKVNSLSIVPGDSILFKKGDTFFDAGLIIQSSGSSVNSITYGSYGTGAKPIITGLVSVTEWTDLGSNIWESSAISSLGSTLNLLLINGVATAMGRYPQNTYLNFESHVSNTSITDNTLTDDVNWTGAELIVRKKRWSFDRSPITAHTGGTLTYTTQTDYIPDDGGGYFIQNDARTVTYQNAWYYDPSTKKIRIYSITEPSGIEVSTIEHLVSITNKNYLTFSGINFRGSNGNIFQIEQGDTIKLEGCNVAFAGNNGLYAHVLSNLTIDNACSFEDINNNGVLLYYNCPNPNINDNIFTRIGLQMGMATGVNYASLSAITMTSESGGCPNATILRNRFDNIGYIPISGGQEGGLIKNNVASNYCVVKDDGGGIYPSSGTPENPLEIIDNIALNASTQAAEGTADPEHSYVWGIYIDDNVHDILISGNTTANNPKAGIFVHNAHEIEITGNNSFNNHEAQFSFQHDLYDEIRNIISYGNVGVALNNQLINSFYSNANDLQDFGRFDNNFLYADDSVINPFYTRSSEDGGTSRTFSDFKTVTRIDRHSSLLRGDVLFEYNDTDEVKEMQLDGVYVDAFGNTYKNSISIPPYKSFALFLNVTVDVASIKYYKKDDGKIYTVNGKILTN